MGFLQSLGNAVKENVRSGLINGFLDATGQSSSQGSSEYIYDSNGRIVGINNSHATEVFGDDNINHAAFDGNNDGGFFNTISRPLTEPSTNENFNKADYGKYSKSSKLKYISMNTKPYISSLISFVTLSKLFLSK